MALTRDQIKAKRGVMPREAIIVPELGDEPIYISKMNAALRDRFDQMVTGGKANGAVDLTNIRARFLTLVCTDEKGTRLFEEDDAEWLGELDTDIVQKLAKKGFELNGINTDDIVEESAKN